MSEKKILREIDSRNALYGNYKYQVRLGRMQASHWDVETWCRNRWGSELEWQSTGFGRGGYQSRNFHWRTVRNGRKSPLLYLKGDAEATLFSMVWAGQ